MPRGDKTGPGGMGPMTGRAAGYCAGSPAPGYADPTIGFGRGLGRGIGRGIGRGFRAGAGWGRSAMYYGPGAQGEPDLDAQRQVLSTQADALQAELDLVKKRLSDLESAGTPE